ncbi:MAG: glycosyltransferase family 9 protein [Bacteroidales bacterium]|nr:glycosyltransferase family 9 protein [Bacteroidales bacterium]
MKKLLIIRFSALGDIAMTVPVVHDLAVQYPDLEITMLSREMARPLFERLPENVYFVAADLNGRHKGLFGLNRLLRDIHFKDFDYIADFHDVLRTQWLRFVCHFAGKKVAKIDKGRKGKKALTRQKNKVFVQQATSFERYAKVLEQLGFPIKPQFTKLDYSSFCGTQKATKETWIGIAPFAKHEAKVYPLEKMEQVIKVLSERENTTVFLFGGGEGEKRQIAELCSKYPNVQTAQCQEGLKGELALMGQLDVMLSMDSANMHLASLVGTRVVSVWGGTHPYAGFLGWNQNPSDCVQLDLPCRPCSVYGNKACSRGDYADYACLKGITPEQIIEKLDLQ